MDMRYEAFCVADPIFYDSPERLATGENDFIAERRVPVGWRRVTRGGWTVLMPPVVRAPTQGWKVHVSATPGNAEHVLDRVWNYCVPRGVGFKFLSDRFTLLMRNAKYADRPGSGKFVTIYPSGPDELERTLRDLGAELDGEPGPYILSDLRWGAGPLFVRYGGFAERLVRTADGEFVSAIEDASGKLVPDLRRPVFEVPEWVEVPDFLAPHVAARQLRERPDDFPYRIERPLHFSNGGGVYVAVDTRTGRRVVLREARPYAGLDPTGSDAVQRLERERDFLAKLAGTGVVPELFEHFTYWEHHFLVEEYIEGQTLGRQFTARYPLIRADASHDDVESYTSWALDILDQVRDGLRELHSRDVVFGDLHPHNIMVRPDGRISFIDFELASYAADRMPAKMGAPGYVPNDGRGGADADRYALACLQISLFLPLTALFPLSAGKADEIVRAIVERFPVPARYATEVLAELRLRAPAAGPTFAAALADSASALPASIGRAITVSATPQRRDRLFPGDIEQFAANGLGLAYGAAGVLYALTRAGIGRLPEHERWLLDAAAEDDIEPRVGFYDGLHGIAYVLDRLGRRDEAVAVLDRALAAPPDRLPAGLFDGLAGVALNLLHFATVTGDNGYRSRAFDLADRLTSDTVRRAADHRGRAGLMRGASGHALLYLRLFEESGDREYLDFAETELRRDLGRCVTAPDGSLQVDDGSRVLPYLASGSAGIGLVLREFLMHRPHEEFADALERIARAATAEFVIQSGLFNGRAGLIALLAAVRGQAAMPAQLQQSIDRHVSRLAWHAIPYRGDVAFPGDQLLRLSMDLATGSAGVLLALTAARDEDAEPPLPFFTGGPHPAGR
ncbi:MAG TPA: class III lanthionine synthetase LanKC [Micromonosporaceae bacterium]|nr:class III lanthionine synthetase LanKC [Micromonosporaceae bacterium]